MVFALTKHVKTNIPVQEEAEAINWSTHQIVRCNIAAAVIESNAKVCVEALTKPSSADQWRISVLSQDTLRVANMTKNEFQLDSWRIKQGSSCPSVLVSL